MSEMEESRRIAMNIEEAALLPARISRRTAGSAALMDLILNARAIGQMRTGETVNIGQQGQNPEPPKIALSATSARTSRAALHHVLQK